MTMHSFRGAGMKFSLGLIHCVGQVVSNCYLPLIKLYWSLVLPLVLKPDRAIKSWNLVEVLNWVFTVAVLLRNSQL